MSGSATVVLASAGTGKTYRLALSTIRLLARGEPPESILASTFTRKAAGEILDRVLGWMARAATDEQEARALCAALGDGEERDREAWAEFLAGLLLCIDRFQITTLDAFFVRLARMHGPELGLPPEWEIVDELDDARLRVESLGRLLQGTRRDELIELLRDLQRADASRSVLDAALRAISVAGDAHADALPGAWSWIEPPPAPSQQAFEAAVAAIAGLDLPRTKSGSPVKHWLSARDQLLELTAAEDWAGLLELTLVAHVMHGAEAYARKPIPDALADAVRTLVARVAHESALQLGRQNEATRRLLDGFAGHDADVRRSARALRFDQLPGWLAGEGLGARWGGRLRHLLLDEFQDTSPAQWRVLAPLAQRLATGDEGDTSVFCVGDVKQSIYGWRKAEPRLLEGLAAELGVEAEDLSESRRSSPVVIDAINRVFEDLAEHPVFSREGWMAATAARFAAGFRPHRAFHAERSGDVLVRTAREVKGVRAQREACLDLAAERAAELHRAAPNARVAILVRRNASIPRLLYSLKERGVLASGEGGNPLDDAVSVRVVLSMLQLADHPGDSAARHHVASSALAEALGLGRPEHAEEAARALREDLAARGYVRVLSDLRPAVAAAFGAAWERRRFDQLVELASLHEGESGLRPSRFVERVRHQRVEDSSAARVRVMTIHRSKGLEFEAVLCPELDLSWDTNPPDLYGRRQGGDPSAPFERVSRAARKSLRGLVPGLQELYESTRELSLTESLCTLYVALTRAVHHLELIVAPRSAKKDEEGLPLSPSALVRHALDASTAEPEEVIWRHEDSSQDWCGTFGVDGVQEDGGAAQADRHPSATIELAPARRARELPRVRPSEVQARRVEVAALFARDGEALRRGTWVHARLQELEWVEAPGAARTEALEGAGLSSEVREALALELDEALANEEFAALFDREACARRLGVAAADLELLRERPFVQLEGPAEAPLSLTRGSIDRATVARAAGVAEVVDFKTDAVRDEAALAERVEHHRPQLEAYRQALARIAGLEPSAVRCRVAFVSCGRVLDLEPS